MITLYDLTNTYFEGSGVSNANAAFGKSKEKRTDCLLVTLALVLDGSGFPKQSEIFAGNASEPATLEKMLNKLSPQAASPQPTVVLELCARERSVHAYPHRDWCPYHLNLHSSTTHQLLLTADSLYWFWRRRRYRRFHWLHLELQG